MKRVCLIAFMAIAFVSCEDTETEELINSTVNSGAEDRDNEILSLKQQLADNDSTMNSYFSYVNEIRENLQMISKEQELIINLQGNPEVISVDNIDLIQELKTLGELMSENENKITQLKAALSNSDYQMSEFEEMIMSLTEDVEMKNREIFQLQQELENLDGAFSELFVAYEEQTEELAIIKDEFNTAYFTFGSKSELTDNGVITKEGGFIGIGKISKLKDDFNKTYFTEVKISELTEISLGVKKADIVTSHPSDSYELIGEDSIEKIVIKDAAAFWGVSKYLVVVVK
jgi:hypothetical protein